MCENIHGPIYRKTSPTVVSYKDHRREVVHLKTKLPHARHTSIAEMLTKKTTKDVTRKREGNASSHMTRYPSPRPNMPTTTSMRPYFPPTPPVEMAIDAALVAVDEDCVKPDDAVPV